MKIKLLSFLILFLINNSMAQLKPIGLQGDSVYSIAAYGDAVYAGTENGVY